MIVIIGNTHDDVLYFESKLRNKKEETILNKFPYITGTIFSQKVCVIYGGYTNYISASIVSSILAKNYVELVINVGRCTSCDDETKTGNIIVSNQTYLGEVNQIGIENAILGQVPTCPQFYPTDSYVLELMIDSINKVVKNVTFKPATIISIEKIVHYKKDIEGISSASGIVFGNNKGLVIDSSTGGIALSCYLNNIPYISVEVVDGKLDETITIDGYIDVLKRYSDIGKSITTFIGEISRKEIVARDKPE